MAERLRRILEKQEELHEAVGDLLQFNSEAKRKTNKE